MSNMRKPVPIAVLIADLHLTLTQPACRADTDWMAVQAEYLSQVKELAELQGGIPVVCAGDVFDRWNTPPELIHFALEHLPDMMLSIPGQHDLPNHREDQQHRSGYGVLVKAGKIQNLNNDSHSTKTAHFFGYGWGVEIGKVKHEDDNRLAIAIIHRYCWMKDRAYPGAPESSNIIAYKKQLEGYDVAVFGDNHIHFMVEVGDCIVYNCGGFIRRRTDEINSQPCVGILMSDGTIQRQRLDTSRDKFREGMDKREEVGINMKDFINDLKGLGEHGLDFREAVENRLRHEDVDEETKKIVLECLQETKSNG